jgi:hypothetical protein
MLQHVQIDGATVQDFVDFSLAWMEDRKYALTVDVDMAAWAQTMRNAPGMSLVNPTFDPEHSPLSAGNSFWLDVRTGSQTIATCAARLIETDDYMAFKRSGRLWHDPLRVNDGALQIDPAPDVPLICGRVGHEGGLWVHPKHRKRGLSVILPHLVRALCAREWDVDWQTAVTRQGVGECGIVNWAYGVPHLRRFFEGISPMTDTHDRLYMAYMDRRELMAGLRLDAATRLLPDRHQQPGDAALLVQEG